MFYWSLRVQRISHCSTYSLQLYLLCCGEICQTYAYYTVTYIMWTLQKILQNCKKRKKRHDYTLLLPLECSHITKWLVLVPKCVCLLLGRFFFLFGGGGGGGGSQLVIYDTDSYCKHVSAWVCCTYRLKGHLSVHSHFLLWIFEAPHPATHNTTHTHRREQHSSQQV